MKTKFLLITLLSGSLHPLLGMEKVETIHTLAASLTTASLTGITEGAPGSLAAEAAASGITPSPTHKPALPALVHSATTDAQRIFILELLRTASLLTGSPELEEQANTILTRIAGTMATVARNSPEMETLSKLMAQHSSVLKLHDRISELYLLPTLRKVSKLTFPSKISYVETNGTLALTFSDNEAQVFNIAQGTRIASFDCRAAALVSEEEIAFLVRRGDSRCGSTDFHLVDLNTNKETAIPNLSSKCHYFVRGLSNRHLLLVTETELIIINAEHTGTKLAELGKTSTGFNPRIINVTSSSRYIIAVHGSDPTTYKIWNVDHLSEEPKTFQVESNKEIEQIVISDNGDVLLYSPKGIEIRRRINEWQIPVYPKLSEGSSAQATAFASVNDRVFVLGYRGGAIHFWDAETTQIIATIPVNTEKGHPLSLSWKDGILRVIFSTGLVEEWFVNNALFTGLPDLLNQLHRSLHSPVTLEAKTTTTAREEKDIRRVADTANTQRTLVVELLKVASTLPDTPEFKLASHNILATVANNLASVVGGLHEVYTLADCISDQKMAPQLRTIIDSTYIIPTSRIVGRIPLPDNITRFQLRENAALVIHDSFIQDKAVQLIPFVTANTNHYVQNSCLDATFISINGMNRVASLNVRTEGASDAKIYEVFLYDEVTCKNKLLYTCKEKTESIHGLCDNSLLLLVGTSSLTIINPVNGVLINEIPIAPEDSCANIQVSGNYLFIKNQTGFKVWVWYLPRINGPTKISIHAKLQGCISWYKITSDRDIIIIKTDGTTLIFKGGSETPIGLKTSEGSTARPTSCAKIAANFYAIGYQEGDILIWNIEKEAVVRIIPVNIAKGYPLDLSWKAGVLRVVYSTGIIEDWFINSTEFTTLAHVLGQLAQA